MMYFPTQWGAKEASKSQGSCVPEGAYRTAQVVLCNFFRFEVLQRLLLVPLLTFDWLDERLCQPTPPEGLNFKVFSGMEIPYYLWRGKKDKALWCEL